MKILITGGAGFIGSYLAEALIDKGHKIFILDDLSTGTDYNLTQIAKKGAFTFYPGSITKPMDVELLVRQVDLIFHLAAVVGVKKVLKEPINTILTNVEGTANVLKFANKHKKKIILASTSEVYGKNDMVLLENSDRILGNVIDHRWAYACSKTVDEFLGLAYYKEHDLPVTIVRFFNTVGPRQTSDHGMVIPTFVKQALNNEDLTVSGSGMQSRCFCHVLDTVSYLVKLMDSDGIEGQIYNIGNPKNGVRILDLADKIIEYADSKSKVQLIYPELMYGKGFADMRCRYPSIDKVKDKTDYECQYSLDTTINSVINYYDQR